MQPKFETAGYSLALVGVELEKYIQQAEFANFKHQSDQQFVLDTLNCIRTLLAQNHWNRRGGLLVKNKGLTQQALNTEAHLTQVNSTALTEKVLNRLLVEVLETFKILKELNQAPVLREILLYCLQVIDLSLPELSAAKLPPQKNTPILCDSPEYLVASLFQGRYLAFSQIQDPLKGRNKKTADDVFEGHCYGHLIHWIDEIKKYGSSTSLPRTNLTVIREQNNQPLVDPNKLTGFYNQPYHLNTSVSDTVKLIQPGMIYNLIFNSQETAHALGIRKFKNGSYEIYDSNTGIFVFNNQHHFTQWLTFMASKQMPTTGALYLIEKKEDAINARPSIPPLALPNPSAILINLQTKMNQAIARFSVECINAKNPTEKNQILAKFYSYYCNTLNLILQKQPCPIMQAHFEKKLNSHLFQIQQNLGLPETTLEKFNARITADHAHLKLQIIAKIDNEILRLKNTWVGDVIPKIAAFENLKTAIKNSPAVLTLKTIINTWQTAQPINSRLTHWDIIGKHRIALAGPTTSQSFVENLIHTAEVSPYQSQFLQTIMLERLKTLLFNSDWSELVCGYGGITDPKQGKIPSSVQQLKNTITELGNQKKSAAEILMAIQKIAGNVHGGFLWRSYRWRSNELNIFYEILKDMQPDQPTKLSHTLTRLEFFNASCLKGLSSKPPVVAPGPKAIQLIT